jgi:hypothetical protein
VDSPFSVFLGGNFRHRGLATTSIPLSSFSLIHMAPNPSKPKTARMHTPRRPGFGSRVLPRQSSSAVRVQQSHTGVDRASNAPQPGPSTSVTQPDVSDDIPMVDIHQVSLFRHEKIIYSNELERLLASMFMSIIPYYHLHFYSHSPILHMRLTVSCMPCLPKTVNALSWYVSMFLIISSIIFTSHVL